MFGGVALLLGLALCLLVAWLTGTGPLGFGIAVVGLLVTGLGLLNLRETRRLARAVRRVDGEVRNSRRETRAALQRLERTVGTLRTGQRTTASGLRELDKTLDGQRTTLQTVVAAQKEVTRAVASGVHPELLSSQLRAQLSLQQALLNLFDLVPARGVVPAMGGSAVAPDLVALLVAELLRLRPRLMLECGSGVSTLWLARTVQEHELDCRISCLDSEPDRAEQTRRLLRAHGVDQHADVRTVPLAPTGLDEHTTPWYDLQTVPKMADIGLLFVHGPPESTGPLARYPAVPLLKSQLATTATVVLDDAVRPSGQEIAARWRLQLPDFDQEEIGAQNDTVIFRREAASPAHD